MDETARAEARRRTYLLLARLAIEGLTPSTVHLVRCVPAFEDVIGDVDADHWASEHHRVWSLELRPIASVLLTQEGRLMGAPADEADAGHRGTGFADRTGEPPDHLGVHLRWLSWLSAEPASEVGQRLALDLLLRWLPALVVSVGALSAPFATRVAELACELAVSHRAALPGEVPPPAPVEGIAATAGLQEFAASLTTPARLGVALCPAALRQIGTTLEIPTGFGARARTMAHLLRGAHDTEQLPDLMARLVQHVDAADAGYAALEVRGAPVAPWRRRLTASRGALSEAAGATTWACPPG
jgi:hypothetical protein